jgi:hypothetical protein
MSSNSFNSSYQFADSLCYTTSVPPSRSLSKSYPAPGRPLSYAASRRNYRRSYGWTSPAISEAGIMSQRKRQSSSFISNSFSNLSYIDYDSDSDSDSDNDSRYDSDSGSTLNNDIILSPSVLSETTMYSSTDNSLRSSNFSPKQRMVSFCEEVDIIKPPMMIDNPKQKNILKKAFKMIKMKKKEVN